MARDFVSAYHIFMKTPGHFLYVFDRDGPYGQLIEDIYSMMLLPVLFCWRTIFCLKEVKSPRINNDSRSGYVSRLLQRRIIIIVPLSFFLQMCVCKEFDRVNKSQSFWYWSTESECSCTYFTSVHYVHATHIYRAYIASL